MKNIYNKILRIPKVVKGKDIFFPIETNCNNETFGNRGAEWTICVDLIEKDSIIYSFGIGEDISFDLAIIEKFNANIYAFDPTLKSIEWIKKQKPNKKFIVHQFGLSDFDGDAKFYLPENPNYVSSTLINRKSSDNKYNIVKMHKLSSIMKQLKHSDIDILKMDIEGSEYDVIEDIIKSEIKIKQLMIEFHHRFDEIGISKTKEAVLKLNNYGYKIFYISKTGEEISFIK